MSTKQALATCDLKVIMHRSMLSGLRFPFESCIW